MPFPFRCNPAVSLAFKLSTFSLNHLTALPFPHNHPSSLIQFPRQILQPPPPPLTEPFPNLLPKPHPINPIILNDTHISTNRQRAVPELHSGHALFFRGQVVDQARDEWWHGGLASGRGFEGPCDEEGGVFGGGAGAAVRWRVGCLWRCGVSVGRWYWRWR